MSSEPHAFFVYGTLKRGQSNHQLIAGALRDVAIATVRGRLYDVGPFPALADGDDRVYGEVLTIDPNTLPRLLAILDDLEGYDPSDPGGSMYVRRLVTATDAEARELVAHAYFYNRDPAAFVHLPGGEWRGPSAAEVAPLSAELTDFGRHVRDFPH
jgi:gamma-glutamylcyclotransferase (GGCT)/AIG2-like uncharacterized protein YtfP